MELTLTCSCGTDLREEAADAESIDGIVRCICGARYAYSSTMLVRPDAEEPVEDLVHNEPVAGERTAGQIDDR